MVISTPITVVNFALQQVHPFTPCEFTMFFFSCFFSFSLSPFRPSRMQSRPLPSPETTARWYVWGDRMKHSVPVRCCVAVARRDWSSSPGRAAHLHYDTQCRTPPAGLCPQVALQDAEYKLVGTMKQLQEKMGTSMYCHGAIGLWRRDVLGKKVWCACLVVPSVLSWWSVSLLFVAPSLPVFLQCETRP